jgi:hypothetical protein
MSGRVSLWLVCAVTLVWGVTAIVLILAGVD